MRSAVKSSNGVSSTVVPQTLEHPGCCNDWGCPASGPPFIGHCGTNSGTQSSKAAEKSHNLQTCHLVGLCRQDVLSFGRYGKRRGNQINPRQANYTVDMCFTEMIYRQHLAFISSGDGETRVSKSDSKGSMSWQLVINFWASSLWKCSFCVPMFWCKKETRYHINKQKILKE